MLPVVAFGPGVISQAGTRTQSLAPSCDAASSALIQPSPLWMGALALKIIFRTYIFGLYIPYKLTLKCFSKSCLIAAVQDPIKWQVDTGVTTVTLRTRFLYCVSVSQFLYSLVNSGSTNSDITIFRLLLKYLFSLTKYAQ